MSEANKAIFSRAWEELINKGNLDIVDELFAQDYVFHDPHFPLSGRDELKGFATALRDGFSEIHLKIDDLVSEGDRVVKRFTLTGTHTADFMGIPPSGKTLTLTGLTMGRIANGQIAEDWEGADWLGWRQPGIIPEPAKT